MTDASFSQGKEKPLKLIARDKSDSDVVSALIQDSIAERKEMLYEPEKHAFSLLLRRFRWEDVEFAKQQGRELERVQSVLTFHSVRKVQFGGFPAGDAQLVFDLIGLVVEDNQIRIVFAGDGEIKLDIETIDIFLSDVSRPYVAKAQDIPTHDEG